MYVPQCQRKLSVRIYCGPWEARVFSPRCEAGWPRRRGWLVMLQRRGLFFQYPYEYYSHEYPARLQGRPNFTSSEADGSCVLSGHIWYESPPHPSVPSVPSPANCACAHSFQPEFAPLTQNPASSNRESKLGQGKPNRTGFASLLPRLPRRRAGAQERIKYRMQIRSGQNRQINCLPCLSVLCYTRQCPSLLFGPSPPLLLFATVSAYHNARITALSSWLSTSA
jgi:hypothetical protein